MQALVREGQPLWMRQWRDMDEGVRTAAHSMIEFRTGTDGMSWPIILNGKLDIVQQRV